MNVQKCVMFKIDPITTNLVRLKKNSVSLQPIIAYTNSSLLLLSVFAFCKKKKGGSYFMLSEIRLIYFYCLFIY